MIVPKGRGQPPKEWTTITVSSRRRKTPRVLDIAVIHGLRKYRFLSRFTGSNMNLTIKNLMREESGDATRRSAMWGRRGRYRSICLGAMLPMWTHKCLSTKIVFQSATGSESKTTRTSLESPWKQKEHWAIEKKYIYVKNTYLPYLLITWMFTWWRCQDNVHITVNLHEK